MSLVNRCGNVGQSKTGVLMARLVDPHGRLLHTSMVRSIQYSLYELSESGSPRKRLVANHIGRQMRVDKVVADELNVGRSWDIDAIGYNFRHRFVVKSARLHGDHSPTMYELRYVITQTTGERSVVCFRVRMLSHD
ncbi:MAG TPA: hypothetical protein VH107_16125 [Lacipirellulaceae bacterium]|nr:hypothetical protein [Lacipirellulaceae bacterium]